jgi:uncharacterized membrane protein
VRRSSVDLLVVGSLAIVAAAVGAASGDSSNALRAGLGLPFVLFLPGYALSAALLPDGRMGLVERLALSLGLSVAVAAIGGLLLNLVPSGLTASSWRFLLLGVTLVASGYAFWRRQHDRIPGPGALVTQISVREAALLSSAALLIGLALGLGATGVNPLGRSARADTPFTQLWAIPSQNGQQTVVHLGLHNYEGKRIAYRVTLETDNRVLAEWPQVTLEDGDSWQAQATLPATLSGQEVSANAYRAGDTAPYRHVRVVPDQGSGQ